SRRPRQPRSHRRSRRRAEGRSRSSVLRRYRLAYAWIEMPDPPAVLKSTWSSGATPPTHAAPSVTLSTLSCASNVSPPNGLLFALVCGIVPVTWKPMPCTLNCRLVGLITATVSVFVPVVFVSFMTSTGLTMFGGELSNDEQFAPGGIFALSCAVPPLI